MKYASDELVVKEFLRNYFEHVAVNTYFNIQNMIMISRKESRLDYDLELLVKESDIMIGYIKPGYTKM
jgi:hypothetical protein